MKKFSNSSDEVISDEIQEKLEARSKPYSDVRRASTGELGAVDHGENESASEVEIIFLGNGPLAENALKTLQQNSNSNILFHARTKDDLAKVAELKKSHPGAFGILASFGVIIKPDLLELFEPEGILNIHPSLLPEYRGPSPIETAILDGDTDFSYSIMKLAKSMDAGPIYHQETFSDLPLDKAEIYQKLATSGAEWLIDNLSKIRSMTPVEQDNDKATFTAKLDKSLSELHPESSPAKQILRQIIAYQGFPKPKYEFFGKRCIILKAHLVDSTAIVCDPSIISDAATPLMIKCQDRNFVAVDELQPEGKKPMSAKAFINGYGKTRR